MANGALPSESPSVSPAVIDHDSPVASPVLSRSTIVAPLEAVSLTEPVSSSVRTGATSVTDTV